MHGYNRSKSAQSASNQHFDSGKYEIIGKVLSWKPNDLSIDLVSRPLSTQHRFATTYYDAFKPLILEETAAIIRNGLEQIKLKKTPASTVRLITSKVAKNNENNPSYLTMEGSLAVEENLQAVVVLLKHASGMQLLGITSQDKASGRDDQLRIKVILDDEALIYGPFNKERSPKWQLYVLGSIVTQIRMYEVCTSKPDTVFLRECLTASPAYQLPQTPDDLFADFSAPRLETLSRRLPIEPAYSIDQKPSEKGIFGQMTDTVVNGFMSLFASPSSQPDNTRTSTLVSVKDTGRALENSIQERTMPANIISLPKMEQDKTPTINNKVEIEKALDKFNPSQRKAIDDFVQLRQGLQLLQGPPGTGKTTTIVELMKILCQQKQRILVCAPSNKAVQVLAKRFFETNPDVPMALAGIEKKVPPELRDIFIHTWGKDVLGRVKKIFEVLQIVRQQGFETQPQQAQQVIKKAYQDYQAILTKLKHAVPKLYCDERQAFISASDNYQAVLLKIADIPLAQIIASEELSLRLTRSIDQNMTVLTDILKRLYQGIEQVDRGGKLELMLLDHAQVVFATLCVSGRDAMKKMTPVDVLIVDEAAQSVEAETLIAFQHQPKKCLLVGDTKQLPALVQSELAREYHLDWSMMWRLMEENSYPYHTLTTQYRMHPAIRSWPSKQYYNDKLEDGEGIKNRVLPSLPPVMMPYAFIDVASQEAMQHHSYSNEKEAAHIVRILKHLRDHHKISIEKRVGIITGYAGQVALIKKKLQGEGMAKVSVHTVDGYQGDECDFILISFVRANHKKVIGFLKDFRRLNVAITRARLSLIMVGHKETLMTANSDIRLLLQDAELRQCVFPEQALYQELNQALQAAKDSAKQVKIKTAKQPTQATTTPVALKPTMNTTQTGPSDKQGVVDTPVVPANPKPGTNIAQTQPKAKKGKQKVLKRFVLVTGSTMEHQAVDMTNQAILPVDKPIANNTLASKTSPTPSQANISRTIATEHDKPTAKKRYIAKSKTQASDTPIIAASSNTDKTSRKLRYISSTKETNKAQQQSSNSSLSQRHYQGKLFQKGNTSKANNTVAPVTQQQTVNTSSRPSQ